MSHIKNRLAFQPSICLALINLFRAVNQELHSSQSLVVRLTCRHACTACQELLDPPGCIMTELSGCCNNDIYDHGSSITLDAQQLRFRQGLMLLILVTIQVHQLAYLDTACLVQVPLVQSLLQLHQLLHHSLRHVPVKHTIHGFWNSRVFMYLSSKSEHLSF